MTSSPLLQKPRTPPSPRKVLVLWGGWSAEREVSFSSGAGVIQALKKLGHQVESLDPPRALDHMIPLILQSFQGQGPHVIFNILHGRDGEDGVIQGVLNLLNIPYTFSGVLGSALAMNKGVARDIVSSHGIRCPQGQVVSVTDYLSTCTFFPHVCKPLGEGSTVGVQLIQNIEEQKKAVKEWDYGPHVLVEQYIPGREIQVAVFGGVAIGAVDIRFTGPIFSYEAKYVEGHAQHLIPAPLEPKAYQEALQMAEVAHKVLQCRGVTRTDFRYDDTGGEPGKLFYLETNPQPGLTPLSLVPEIAQKTQGWSYEEVVQWILEDATCPK